MRNKLGLVFWGIVLLIALLIVGGCGGGKKTLQIKGSDTMVNLVQGWAEAFMKDNPTLSAAVTGGGSGTGIASLLSRTTDIAMCSRDMSKKEIEQAHAVGVTPVEFQVARDGIAVVVSPQSPVKRLTLQQLSDIFSGTTTNWKALGGPDQAIVALSRERNSGTHVFFLEHVVKMGQKGNPKEFGQGVLMMPSSQAIVDEVAGNPSAIGYVGLGYANNKLRTLAIAHKDGLPYVAPNEKTVISGSYPIARTLNFYTNGSPSGEVKSFLDFVLSPAGQTIVSKMDFVPLRGK